MSDLRQRVVRELLADSPKDQRLYMTSATFRAGLDQMVEFLPVFIIGLWAEAEAADARIAAAKAALMRAPFRYPAEEEA